MPVGIRKRKHASCIIRGGGVPAVVWGPGIVSSDGCKQVSAKRCARVMISGGKAGGCGEVSSFES